MCEDIKRCSTYIFAIAVPATGYVILRWLYVGISSTPYSYLAILTLFIVLLCMKQGAIALAQLLLLTALELHCLYCDLAIAKRLSELQTDLVHLKLSLSDENYGNEVLFYGLLRLGMLAILFSTTWQLRKQWSSVAGENAGSAETVKQA